MTVFDMFRASLPAPDALHEGLIGNDAMIDGPFGTHRMIYADYVASGRAHRAIEGFVMEQVLPWYANSHTRSSHCGRIITGLRDQARAEILRCTQGGPEHAVVFTGSGATSGINRLVALMGAGTGVTVLVGPYEHHSNILPWRESGAQVETIPECAEGGPDRAALARALEHANGPVICSFSAASNVTGITTDIAQVTALCKAHGAAVIWDFAGGAPYLPIDLSLGMDAVVVSPHKFLGGPGASGVLLLRRDAVMRATPTQPGGGTVVFVNDRSQDYAESLESREEGGTPNVVGDIRAALVFAMKDAAGQDYISARNAALWHKARARLADLAGLKLLGQTGPERLPILSFQILDPGAEPLHPALTTRMLTDYYGIQARGGCGCAGPYVHELLQIDHAQSDRIRAQIKAGNPMARPGFVRLNLCWAAPEAEIDTILDALCDLSRTGPERARAYLCDSARAMYFAQSDPEAAAL